MTVYKDIVAALERLETRLGAVEKAAEGRKGLPAAKAAPEIARELDLAIGRINHLLKEAGHEPG